MSPGKTMDEASASLLGKHWLSFGGKRDGYFVQLYENKRSGNCVIGENIKIRIL